MIVGRGLGRAGLHNSDTRVLRLHDTGGQYDPLFQSDGAAALIEVAYRRFIAVEGDVEYFDALPEEYIFHKGLWIVRWIVAGGDF